MRVVQLTPPAQRARLSSGGSGRHAAGSVRGLHLVVADIRTARDALATEVWDMGELVEYPGGIKYAAFSDPMATGGPCSRCRPRV